MGVQRMTTCALRPQGPTASVAAALREILLRTLSSAEIGRTGGPIEAGVGRDAVLKELRGIPGSLIREKPQRANMLALFLRDPGDEALTGSLLGDDVLRPGASWEEHMDRDELAARSDALADGAWMRRAADPTSPPSP